MSTRRVTTETIAARIIGKSRAQISRDAAAGRFGPVSPGKQNSKLIDVAAIERYIGRQISDGELTAAAVANKSAPAPAPFDDVVILASIDPGTQAWTVEHRDYEWIRHLHSLGLMPMPMPPPSELSRPMLDIQRFFTRRQVEELIATALDQQSRRWLKWTTEDLVHQAQHPYGPEGLTIKDIKLED